jgi:2-aminoethylphosphonate-pyruvate transaminase
VVTDSSDKLLFTPGPATTSASVKQAMLHDAGSWHFEFNAVVAEIRTRLLALGSVSKDGGYECVLMQGSGSFAVESAITSTVPRDGTLLVAANGAYGKRIARIAEVAGIDTHTIAFAEDMPVDPSGVDETIGRHPGITHVAAVHCETTTGILNPVEEIGHAVKDAGKTYIVDAMSSFGAIPIDASDIGIDFLISSANKCIEGVPGFGFVIARRDALEASEGRARSYTLDLVDQWRGFERTGQFRFTPPTHVILAFAQALDELDREGGVEGRGRRYARNHAVLVEGMRAMGLRPLLDPAVQSCIITSFYYPEHPDFDFDVFYRGLSDRGMIIYPGKLTDVSCFRIGTIGRIFEDDVRALLDAIRDVLREMGVAHAA